MPFYRPSLDGRDEREGEKTSPLQLASIGSLNGILSSAIVQTIPPPTAADLTSTVEVQFVHPGNPRKGPGAWIQRSKHLQLGLQQHRIRANLWLNTRGRHVPPDHAVQ